MSIEQKVKALGWSLAIIVLGAVLFDFGMPATGIVLCVLGVISVIAVCA